MTTNINRQLLLSVFCMMMFICTLGHEALAEAQLLTIPEMQALPFDSYEPLGQDYKITANEQNSWIDFYPFVTDQISDARIVALSRSAIEETRGFHYTPGYPAPLTLYGANRKQVIYTAVLADLPAHGPLVTRQLVVYIVGLNNKHLFLPNTIVITIRGNRNE